MAATIPFNWSNVKPAFFAAEAAFFIASAISPAVIACLDSTSDQASKKCMAPSPSFLNTFMAAVKASVASLALSVVTLAANVDACTRSMISAWDKPCWAKIFIPLNTSVTATPYCWAKPTAALVSASKSVVAVFITIRKLAILTSISDNVSTALRNWLNPP